MRLKIDGHEFENDEEMSNVQGERSLEEGETCHLGLPRRACFLQLDVGEEEEEGT